MGRTYLGVFSLTEHKGYDIICLGDEKFIEIIENVKLETEFKKENDKIEFKVSDRKKVWRRGVIFCTDTMFFTKV